MIAKNDHLRMSVDVGDGRVLLAMIDAPPTRRGQERIRHESR